MEHEKPKPMPLEKSKEGKEPIPRPPNAPYEVISDLVGIVESGVPDLGQNHRKHIIEKMRSLHHQS